MPREVRKEERRGKKRKTSEAGARYPGRVGVLIRVSRSSRISRAEKKREMEIERQRESVGWAKGWQKGGRQTGARRQANGTGGRLPDGRLMEPRADFIFHGPSFLIPSPPSALRDRALLLSSRQGAETRCATGVSLAAFRSIYGPILTFYTRGKDLSIA